MVKLFSLVVAAAAMEKVCRDAPNSLVNTLNTYAGGAPPPSDMVTRTEMVAYAKGDTLKNEYSEAKGWSRQFNATFETTSLVKLSTKIDHAKNLQIVTIAESLIVKADSQADWDGYVICDASSPLFPPP
jgi:hypothetical protein